MSGESIHALRERLLFCNPHFFALWHIILSAHNKTLLGSYAGSRASTLSKMVFSNKSDMPKLQILQNESMAALDLSNLL